MDKNITLSVDSVVLDKVKVIAAARRTSVNAMVRSYLNSVVDREQSVDQAREKLLELAREKVGDMGTQTWKREALYDR